MSVVRASGPDGEMVHIPTVLFSKKEAQYPLFKKLDWSQISRTGLGVSPAEN